jgi:uncharacterized protein YkwD
MSGTPSPSSLALPRRMATVVIFVLISVISAFVANSSPASAAAKPSASQTRAVKALEARLEASMLVRFNAERKANHLPALRANKNLDKSATAHSLAMAQANTMSHQLRAEANFGDRILKAGYNWQAAAENVGWSTDKSTHGILVLEQMMYNEKAPNNGHRLNILSTNYRDIGIDVYVDTVHNKIWFTQDMGKLM